MPSLARNSKLRESLTLKWRVIRPKRRARSQPIKKQQMGRVYLSQDGLRYNTLVPPLVVIGRARR